MVKRHQALAIFCCSLLSFLSVFGCGGGNGGGDGGGGRTPVLQPQTVTLQGRVDDGLPHSPIGNANCRFHDLQGTQVTTATADGSGTFRLVVPLNMQGFVRCAPPSLSHLETSAFVSTAGRTAGETIANLTVDPRTTLLAAVLTNTHPSDLQARAAELTAALTAGDKDLKVLEKASTVLYNAQLVNGIDVAFSSGSESDGDSGDGGDSGSGGDSGDGGGTGGDAGDGGAFSPLPGAACDFALTMDGPVLRNATLADFLANGSLGRPDLQAIAAKVNADLAGQQAAIAAAFSRLFPDGLGKPISTTADSNGSYFLRTPAGVPGFVRCNPAEAANLVLARFTPARQIGEQLLRQMVAPATTVAAMVVTNALQDGLDPVPIQNTFLADIAPLQILLPDHPNGNGMFATVQLQPGTTLPNRNEALLAFAATTIFDTIRLQRATIPVTATFANAVQDYFKDATFAPQFAPLTQAVNTALDQGQPVIGLGRNDIPQAARTVGALNSQLFVSDLTGVRRYDGTTGAFLNVFVAAGSGGLRNPTGLVFGPDGQLYVINFEISGRGDILRYDGTTGAFLNVFVAAGSGGLSGPRGLVFGPDDQLYVGGAGTNPILRYDGTTGAFLNVFVAAGSGGLFVSNDLVFGPDGQLYVYAIKSSGAEILRYDGTTGAFLNVFVAAGSGGLSSLGLVGSQRLVFGPDGQLYVINIINSAGGGRDLTL